MDTILLVVRDAELPNTSTSLEEKYVSIIKDRLYDAPIGEIVICSTYPVPNARAFELLIKEA